MITNKLKNVRAYIQEMSQAEAYDMIPANTLANIKATDPDPMVRVYRVGHEGESKGRMLGVGEVVKKWTKSVVSKLVGAIQEGVGLFLGHGKTNDTAGRTRLGHVVGSKLVEKDGRAEALVATYFYPNMRDQAKDLDLCSIETEIDFTLDGDEAKIVDVLPVTGIALGSSDQGVAPGFPEAGLITSLQFFYERAEIQEEKMELKDVRAFIIDQGLNPLDLFDEGDVMKLEPVAKAVEEAKHDGYGYGDRWKKKFEKAEQELEEIKKESVPKKDFDELQGKVKTISAKPTVLSVVSEIKDLDPKEKAFIEKRADRFTPEASDDEAMRDEASKFVETQRAEFKEVLEIADPDYKPGDPANVPPGDGGGNSGTTDNPFLPE